MTAIRIIICISSVTCESFGCSIRDDKDTLVTSKCNMGKELTTQ